MTQMATIIVSTLFSFFASIIGMIIFEVYKPDVKKHTPLIKSLISFTLRYILPIAAVIFLMVYSKEVTKYFVLGLALNVGALLANAILEISRSVDHLQEMQSKSFDLHLRAVESMRDILNGSHDSKTGMADVISRLIDTQKQFLQIQKLNLQLFDEVRTELKKHKIKIEIPPHIKHQLQQLQQDLSSDTDEMPDNKPTST